MPMHAMDGEWDATWAKLKQPEIAIYLDYGTIIMSIFTM